MTSKSDAPPQEVVFNTRMLFIKKEPGSIRKVVRSQGMCIAPTQLHCNSKRATVRPSRCSHQVLLPIQQQHVCFALRIRWILYAFRNIASSSFLRRRLTMTAIFLPSAQAGNVHTQSESFKAGEVHREREHPLPPPW